MNPGPSIVCQQQPRVELRGPNPIGKVFRQARDELAVKAFVIMNQGRDLQQWFEEEIRAIKLRTAQA